MIIPRFDARPDPGSAVVAVGLAVAVTLVAAACGVSGFTTGGRPASTEFDNPAATVTPPADSAAPGPETPTAEPAVATPGGADVTGIAPCSLLTQAEAEAALGVASRAPFATAVAGVNVVSCLYQDVDGEGPQVGVTVMGAPDPFRPDLVPVAPEPPLSAAPTAIDGLGDEAWWWVDPRGFRVEARDADRYVSFEFNDFRGDGPPTEASLAFLVPLMQTVLSRLP